MYNITIDQSTFSTKAMLFDEEANMIARVNKNHRQISPETGWVEHNPDEIYNNTKEVVAELVRRQAVSCRELKYISITNQRETTVMWDESGKPVYNAVVWQCARAQDIVNRSGIADRADYIKDTSGMPLTPYFSAAKACWIKEHADRDRKLYFGTMDSWLIYKLTGNHYTDFSNASRTQLMDIKRLCWDQELIRIFGLEDVVFPKILPADAFYGETDFDGILDGPVPIYGVLGDSHGALFGQQCWQSGTGKCTFGTGSSVMVNIGDKPLMSDDGLVTSVAWNISGQTNYVYEGNINCTGDTLNWLKNELGILPEANVSEEFAVRAGDSNGVYIVPAFLGLGAPYYDAQARGLICGLFRDANRYHIVRAALESTAYQINDIISLIKSKVEMKELRVDGGGTNNRFLMQFVADICNLKIVKNRLEELSALGAYYAGGLGAGRFKSMDEISCLYRKAGEFNSEMSSEKADALYGGWKDAVAKARSRHIHHTA